MIEWLALALLNDESEVQEERIKKLEKEILDVKLSLLYIAKIELKRKMKEVENNG
jgi:hypothetical protein